MTLPRKPDLQIESRPVPRGQRDPRLYLVLQRYRATAVLKVPAGGTYTAKANGITRRGAENRARAEVEALAAAVEARRVKAL